MYDMAQDNRLLRPMPCNDDGGAIGPPPPPQTYRILQEDGSYLLTESDSHLRKEQTTR
jgi:hypothetical protein